MSDKKRSIMDDEDAMAIMDSHHRLVEGILAYVEAQIENKVDPIVAIARARGVFRELCGVMVDDEAMAQLVDAVESHRKSG